jgi:hypothetical protein
MIFAGDAADRGFLVDSCHPNQVGASFRRNDREGEESVPLVCTPAQRTGLNMADVWDVGKGGRLPRCAPKGQAPSQ